MNVDVNFTEQPQGPRAGFVTNYPHYKNWKKSDHKYAFSQNPLSIYIHIPFCAQQCSYCYYKVLTGTDRALRDQYIDALCREIEIASDQFQLRRREIVSVYFGGGTPTLLTEAQFGKVVDTLQRVLNLHDFEFTVEAEPVTLTKKTGDYLRKAGVNRLSLGVQSLSDEILKKTNRHDTEASVFKAIEIAKTVAPVVNIDLLSGLSGETCDTWAYSVERAIASGAESITIYKVDLYSNSEYYRDLRHGTLTLPNDEVEMDFMRYAQAELFLNGYKPWSFFTFTKDGKYPHRHSSNIWQGGDCYALGASAFGVMGNSLFQNTNDPWKYVQSINSNELAIHRGYQLSNLEKMIREALLGMKLVRFSLVDYQRRHGFKLHALCDATVRSLIDDGYIEMIDDEIVKTDKGILYADYVGKQVAKDLTARFC